ncbi:MAG: uroporphyrinogen-III synthase [Chitinophagaceae bacterium]|nr:MAG: uroporphyrinogen-III synthase [Chitinophagaceae bacterium]
MPKAERTILSTRPLPATLILEAAAEGFAVNCLSFIETEAIADASLMQRVRFLATEPHSVIFTSMNAVDAVSSWLKDRPQWSVYCIGHSTRERVEEELQAPVAGTADDASALADRIIAAGEQSLLFFCGDQRRDVLPLKLREAGITLDELTVYRTIATPHALGRDYSAVLFFSPSAVQSYASANQFSPSTVSFAIGSSTAEALLQAGADHIVTAKQPGKETLLRLAIEHFRNFTTTE